MELLERDVELLGLRRCWDHALAGSGSIAVLAGESGIGKTSLARVFADGLGTRDVLWGVCDPLGVPRPLGPLHDVAADLGVALARQLAAGAPPHVISAELLGVLTSRSLLLVVDDLQWADEATLDLLRFLVRRVSGTRSLVLVTYRADDLAPSHPLRALLGDLARTAGAVRFDLAPLSVDAVTTMVGARRIDPAHLHRLTRGNSFFVTEVVSQDGATLPATVRDAVLARAADLDPPARDLADLLSCAAGAVPDDLLPALGVGIGPLRALDAAGLIARERRGIGYRHDICRLAIAEALPPGGEAGLHRRMLEAFETHPDPDPAVLTHHALGAGDGERVFRYASRAGRAAAASGAHTEAARLFRTAFERAPVEALGARAELCSLLATELYLTDRLGEAIAAAHRAVAWRRAEGDARGLCAARQLLAVFEWYSGNRGSAVQHAAAAVAELEPDPRGAASDLDPPDRTVLGHAYAIQAFLALQGSDLAAALERHDRAREVTRDVEDPTLAVRLAVVTSMVGLMTGDGAARGRVLDVLEGDGSFTEAHSAGYSNLANLDVEQRRFDDAREVLDRSLPLTVQWDVPLCHHWQRGVRGRLRMLRGAWDDALGDARAVLADSGSLLTHTWPHLVQGLVGLRRGTTDADEHLERGWELAVRYGEPLRLLPAAAALAERCWLRGTDDARLEDVAALISTAGTCPGTEWSTGDLAVWLARLGRTVATRDLPLAAPHRLLLAGDPAAAAARWRQLGSPYDEALARIDTGRPAETFAALEVLDRLGADAVAATVRRDLRLRGVPGVPARPRGSTRTNPAGLTSRQVDVLRLVADGLTNAEIAAQLVIAEKTVDHHVSAVLAKLDVRTRREAGAAARSLGVAPERRRSPRGARNAPVAGRT
ncbi:ATP-binding protein [Actinomycetospora atypica]|uniref:ATP-binding protein n=1 Tax=Actinomycetospora atypica TaxID=1290095 RepID=A0ABV9YS52_9PSEU